MQARPEKRRRGVCRRAELWRGTQIFGEHDLVSLCKKRRRESVRRENARGIFLRRRIPGGAGVQKGRGLVPEGGEIK